MDKAANQYYLAVQGEHNREVESLLRERNLVARLDPGAHQQDEARAKQEIKRAYKDLLTVGKDTTPQDYARKI